MSGISLSLVMDIVLIGLLGTGIYYALRLERRFKALQASRQDMERLVHEFGGIVMRAEDSIGRLKQATELSGKQLDESIDKAKELRGEMGFMVESANAACERLSHQFSPANRQDSASSKASSKRRESVIMDDPFDQDMPGLSMSEQRLAQALQRMKRS
ncbi:MAG: hypothetical protein IPI58_09240 [Alphaproteobacteria bacterium]|nr:MAG: hypothetical protein IPI58_09240 [Alphaproteobacteria bacterium]